MEYEEFIQQVLDEIRDFLPEQYAGADISLIQTVKVNDIVHDGLVIQTPENSIAPAIYLNSYYEEYRYGRDMESILQQIADVRDNSLDQEDIDLSLSLKDFDQVKDRITCRLVNIESNSLYLADKPYTSMEDLAVIYDIQMCETGYESLSVPINKSMFETYGVDIKELHATAVKNMETLSPCVFESLAGKLMGAVAFLPESERQKLEKTKDVLSMSVLSDQNNMYGAAAVLNDKMMRYISRKLGKDFYVLPSSRHEVIILPKEPELDFKGLEFMVKEVNIAEVAPYDRLSDHVYEYHIKERRLVRCDWEEERMAGRNLAEEKKPSIKEQLSVPPVAGKRPVLKPELAR